MAYKRRKGGVGLYELALWFAARNCYHDEGEDMTKEALARTPGDAGDHRSDWIQAKMDKWLDEADARKRIN